MDETTVSYATWADLCGEEPDDWEDDPNEEDNFDCGWMGEDLGCQLAGTEDCDFECPWHEYHYSRRLLMRELPQPGERWRHFKGNEYVVIAIAILIKKTPSDSDIPEHEKRWVVYSKMGQFNLYEPIFSTEDNSTYWFHSLLLGSIVKSDYQWDNSLLNENTVWARPLDNFMQILSNDESEYYRSLASHIPTAFFRYSSNSIGSSL